MIKSSKNIKKMEKKLKCDLHTLYKILAHIKKTRILVIGDLILDHYIYGSAERLSPEAPVPVVWAHKESYLLGGASNVAHNLASLGSNAALCGVVGKDHYGSRLLALAREQHLGSEFVIRDSLRPTSLKTRIVGQHQQIVRIDWESREELSSRVSEKIIQLIQKNIDLFDAFIIEDYGKGVINARVLEEILPLCNKKKKIVTVDPKEDHFDLYKNVTALTPNLKEAQNAANFRIRKKEDISIVKDLIMERLCPQALLITRGEEGMSLFLKDRGEFHLPTFALEVFDVSGAGDTVIAVFTAALACGGDFLEAAALANVAAGIVVGKFGVSTVSPWEFKERLEDIHDVYFSKL